MYALLHIQLIYHPPPVAQEEHGKYAQHHINRRLVGGECELFSRAGPGKQAPVYDPDAIAGQCAEGVHDQVINIGNPVVK